MILRRSGAKSALKIRFRAERHDAEHHIIYDANERTLSLKCLALAAYILDCVTHVACYVV